MVVMSADWVERLKSAGWIIIGLVTSYLLAVSVLHELFVLFITRVWLVYGIGCWSAAHPEPLTFRNRLLELNFRLGRGSSGRSVAASAATT